MPERVFLCASQRMIYPYVGSAKMNDTYKKAHKSIDLMEKSGVPPTPSNYEFWFHTLGQTDAALSQDVKTLLEKKGAVDERDISRLRRTHFGQDGTETLASLTETTQQHLNRLSNVIESAGGDTKLFRSALESGRGDLQANLNPEEQRKLIEHILLATTTMVDKSEKLEAKLATSSKEVNTLKKDLEKARTESRTDALTGLPNRSAFQSYIDTQAARTMTEGKPLSMIFADIDHFKRFNDTWGHRLGDEVLRLVGQCLEQMCQGLGYPARYGGEEFVIVVPGKSLKSAADIAEQLRDFVASKTVRAKSTQQTVGRITLSMGVSELRPDDTIGSLIERADQALYHAKNKGRNRVCTENDLADETTELRKQA
jgi:diguanylate cyclase